MAGDGANIGNAYLTVHPKVSDGFGSELQSAGSSAGTGFGTAFQVALGNILSNVVQEAAQFVTESFKEAFNAYADYEQLVGGVEKIFDEMDNSRIFADAQNAYKELNMSANEYLETINQTGAVFATTMGDERGYEIARQGMLAVSDYASGTGRDIDELNEKFKLITRSSGSYQSIADQFAGILPQTSEAFLEQAQQAGYLSDQYTKLSEVPIDEYQQALVYMLQDGVSALGLSGNTLAESTETISGSLAMLDSAWSDFLVGIFDEDADMESLMDKLLESLGAVFENAFPRLQEAADTLFRAIPDELMRILEENFPGAAEMIRGLADAWTPVGENMAKIAEENGPLIMEALQMLADLAGEYIVPALEHLGNAASDFTEAIGPWMPHIINVATILGGAFIEALGGAIDKVAFLIEVVAKIIETVKKFADACGHAPEKVGKFADDVGNYFGKVDDDVSVAMDNAVKSVSDWADGLRNDAGNALGEFEDKVYNVFHGAAMDIDSALRDAKETVKGVIEEIKGFFNFQIQWPHINLPHFWASGSPNPLEWLTEGIPQFGIDWYASGGIFDRPTIAGLGEAGPEMILPRSGGLMDEFAETVAARVRGDGGVDIHDCTFVVRRESDIRKVAEELNSLIGRQMIGGLA